MLKESLVEFPCMRIHISGMERDSQSTQTREEKMRKKRQIKKKEKKSAGEARLRLFIKSFFFFVVLEDSIIIVNGALNANERSKENISFRNKNERL